MHAEMSQGSGIVPGVLQHARNESALVHAPLQFSIRSANQCSQMMVAGLARERSLAMRDRESFLQFIPNLIDGDPALRPEPHLMLSEHRRVKPLGEGILFRGPNS